MRLAGEAATGAEWIGGVVILIVLAPLVGYLVLKAVGRNRARAADAERIAESLPVEYRSLPLPSWRYAVGIVSLAVLPALVVPLAGRFAAVLAPGIVIGLLVFGTLRRQRTHREEIVASVKARAASMPRDELADLVVRLEANHGQVEMRPLRELLVQRGVV